jgi:hypothetical protein
MKQFFLGTLRMKRLLAIGSLVSLASIGACGSGPDLTKTAPDVAIVDVAPGNVGNSNCGAGCGFISGFAVGSSGVYSMFDVQGGTGTLLPQLKTVDFASHSVLTSSWTPIVAANGTGATSTDYDIVSSSDHQLFWAGTPVTNNSAGANATEITIYSSTESSLQTPNAIASFVATLPTVDTGSSNGNGNDGGAGGNTGSNAGGLYLVGLAADPDAIYVEYTQDGQQTNGGANQTTPDSQSYPGAGSPIETRDVGVIAQIMRSAPQAAPKSVSSFFVLPNSAIHSLAQSSKELYFADEGQANNPSNQVRVLSLTKIPFGTTPNVVGALTLSDSAGATVVGIAANDTNVAWAVSYLSAQPYGCVIFGSAHDGLMQKLYDGRKPGASNGGPAPLSGCSGLAVDDTYAYVAITDTISTSNGGNQIVTVGSGIARVPLAGGPLQIVSLQSQEWYGPRRVFVDATYVYAVDPNYVARFAKSDFGP